MATELSVWTVGRMCGIQVPPVGRRIGCPFREHKRKQKHFSVFVAASGETLFKCHACNPPDNVGDAVALYAKLCHMERKAAWNELREKGYAVPGLRDDDPNPCGPSRRAAPPKPKPKPIPVRGRRPGEVLPLDLRQYQTWCDQRTGAVERFASQRGLCAEAIRRLGVLDMRRDVIGFTYRDPDREDARPCRIKCRPLDKKTFWIEPRPPKGTGARAIGPLYLAERLSRPLSLSLAAFGRPQPCVITEGETDALSLASLGIENVVSLPDGWESSGTVSVAPIDGFGLWLCATDADPQGEEAYKRLRKRARAIGVTTARVRWQKDGQLYKDANDALLAGWSAGDFRQLLATSAAAVFGYQVNVA